VLAAIERIVNGEAAAAGAVKSPEITLLDRYPLGVNDAEASKRAVGAFCRHFPTDRILESEVVSASEDCWSFRTEWHAPWAFWFVGGTNPDSYAKAEEAGRLNEIPTNQNPGFLPVIHPTLETGVEALAVAAQAWVSADG
jgi:hypothetical protein